MWYCIAHYDESGRPVLPEGAHYLQLASPGDWPWAVFAVEGRQWAESQLPPSLVESIQSALAYPPALALARGEAGSRFLDSEPTRDEFCAWYEGALRRLMRSQIGSRFVFVEAAKTVSYLTKGMFYWIEDHGDSESVHWVSEDYILYSARRANFLLQRPPAPI